MKLSIIVVLDTIYESTMSKPIDFGFRRSKVRVRVRVMAKEESAPI